MKKRTRNILIIVGVVVGFFIYGKYDFHNSKFQFRKVVNMAADGDVTASLAAMNSIGMLSNPIINIVYHRWKWKMNKRFVTNEEVFENTSGNKLVQDVSEIYRGYWRTELSKGAGQQKTDSTLYKEVIGYLTANDLSSLPLDVLTETIKNDEELTRLLSEEGFHSKFMLRNGFQDLFIWGKENIEDYTVVLPKDTIETTVVFMNNFYLEGYDEFATCGDSQVGGWAVKGEASLFCLEDGYIVDSDKFRLSYLKHESLHFTDLKDYPNLSSADLEYRAKIIEFIYCTESLSQDNISLFLSSMDSVNRSNAHPYANYCVVRDLSKIVFNVEYENDFTKWRAIPLEKLHEAATQLYNESEAILAKDPNVKEVI